MGLKAEALIASGCAALSPDPGQPSCDDRPTDQGGVKIVTREKETWQ